MNLIVQDSHFFKFTIEPLSSGGIPSSSSVQVHGSTYGHSPYTCSGSVQIWYKIHHQHIPPSASANMIDLFEGAGGGIR